MLEMLELYKATYDEAVHPALISQALSQLRDSGFLSSQMGLPEMVSKLEHKVIYKKRKKMKDWLSPEALSGQLAVDNERWIKASEQYIADERTRARVKARERQK
jgi:DNA-binding transcriptional regulator YhcF (GntR family)